MNLSAAYRRPACRSASRPVFRPVGSAFPRRIAGFTLAEIAIALAVVATGFSIFAVSLGMAARATNSARRQMAAMNFARSEMESLSLLPFGDPKLNIGTYSISNTQYAGSYTVSTLATNTRKEVTVRISWVHAAAGVSTNVTYSRQICDALH